MSVLVSLAAVREQFTAFTTAYSTAVRELPRAEPVLVAETVAYGISLTCGISISLSC
jgi:hypothetical protein